MAARREASMLAVAVSYKGEVTIRVFAGWREGERTPLGLLSTNDAQLADAVLTRLSLVMKVQDGRL